MIAISEKKLKISKTVSRKLDKIRQLSQNSELIIYMFLPGKYMHYPTWQRGP